MTQEINNQETSKLYANEIGYSDVYPHEVVKVVSDNTLEIRAMATEPDPNWKPEWVSGGFAGRCENQSEQSWIYFQSNAEPFRIRRTKKGWTYKGRRFQVEDKPCKFYDFNF